jgi:iron complex outermembrane receptor protein
MKLITLLAASILSSFSLFSQTLGKIEGTVKDVNYQPVINATVQLIELQKISVTTDNGYFQFNKLSDGTYHVEVSFVGYKTERITIKVNSGTSSSVDLILEEDAQNLKEIVVTDNRSLNETPASIGKISINPMDLPQSVMVINHDIINQQQVLRLSDVLMNTNGIYVMGTTGGTQEEIAARGFNFSSNSTFKNGVRFNNGVMPETSSLESVEVLKGSSAILFGNVAAGGVINLVTKKPKFENGGEIGMRIGNYQFYKPTLDIYGKVNDSDVVAYRINTTYENNKSYRDVVDGERYYINPSFLIKAGKKTEVLLEGDYLNDDRTSDFGIGSINYSIPSMPRSRFIGVSWANYSAQQLSSTVTVSHQINKFWKLQGVLGFQKYTTGLYGSSRPNTGGRMIQEDGTWLRSLQKSSSNENYNIFQIDLNGQIKTGSIKHKLLFGSDRDQYETTATAYDIYTNPENPANVVYDTINIFDLSKYVQRTDIPGTAPRTNTTTSIRRFGIYAQDLISISEKLKALAGIRFSYMEIQSKITTVATGAVQNSPTNYNNAFTPRFGLIFQPIKTISLFTSYANSFTMNTGIDNTGKVLPPSFIKQAELGIKNELFKGFLSLNITAYEIINDNLAQTILTTSPNYNPDFPNAQELSGEVTSKGIEIDIMSRPYHGFSVMGGYSFNDTRYTKSTIYENGSRLRYNPSHTANVSTFYTFKQSNLKSLQVGFTTLYVGDRIAGRNTRLTVPNDNYQTFAIPNYMQFDFSAGYTLDRISVRMKISNLLNQLSYNIHDDNSVNPIAPRLLSTTISYKL